MYSKCGGGCPLTCGNPYILCLIQGCFPGCMCPDGQLIDEAKKRCVPREQCPSPGVQASDDAYIHGVATVGTSAHVPVLYKFLHMLARP